MNDDVGRDHSFPFPSTRSNNNHSKKTNYEYEKRGELIKIPNDINGILHCRNVREVVFFVLVVKCSV